ncbi:MAG: hypothetical protein U0172_11375 [Nitrospiraceae bacterium]
MGTSIPEQHPLRQWFGALTERTFVEKLGWSHVGVTDYLSNLLVEFTHVDTLYQMSHATPEGEARVDTLVGLLYESEVLLNAQSFERECEVHRHIGDFTLFMAGLFPEYLRRLKRSGMIHHPDFLVDYVKTGKRSYRIVAEALAPRTDEASPVFQTLSENFELCVTGLGFVRRDLDRLQQPDARRLREQLFH